MMLHGARAAICWSRGKDTPLARWINPMIERRGFNKAVVALANKNARIAWHMVAEGAHYDPGKAFGSARSPRHGVCKADEEKVYDPGRA